MSLPGSMFKKVHFLAFLRKTIKKVHFCAKQIKKDLFLDFYAMKNSTFFAFLRKVITKGAFSRIFTLKTSLFFRISTLSD